MFSYMSRSNCPECGGKGFKWIEGKIISRKDGKEIATTHRNGGTCPRCGGTGEIIDINYAVFSDFSRKFAYSAIGLAMLAFAYHAARYFLR